MTTRIVEELPLIRGKNDGAVISTATGPNIGPGSYDVDYHAPNTFSRAPFNTTGERRPLYDNDPSVPGPGSYELGYVPPDERLGVSGIPFVSESARFAEKRNEDYPGPGSYDTMDKWPTKKDPRSHKFTFAPERNVADVADTRSGPGYYEPNYNAVARKNPKAVDFGRASGRRDLDLTKDIPGPGSYNQARKVPNIYDAKPSSMFATNTKRSNLGGSDTPGPGAYDIGTNASRRAPAQPYSAFGSATNRFAPLGGSDAPGPGAYTGDIAPRRYKPYQNDRGSAPFASHSNRFGDSRGESPGPGSYDGKWAPKHLSYGAETPFQSTVTRFGPANTYTRNPLFDSDGFYQTDPSVQKPRELSLPRRPFNNRAIAPTLGPEVLPERSYNVNYDGHKPQSSTRGTLGLAPRDTAPRKATSAPGPGTYDSHAARGAQFNNSNWSHEPRFRSAGDPTHAPEGGRTYYESTFLTKSHNVTIGSDTMWTR